MIEDLKDIFDFFVDTKINSPIFLPKRNDKIIGRPYFRDIKKVIFEKDCCIIVDTLGNSYISRPEKGDKYDKEKGFLVALAKYNGFSTTNIQKLIKGAIVKNADKKCKSKKTDKKN